MPLVMCLLFLLFVMGISFTDTVGIQYKMAGEKEYGLASLYTADAGTQYALALIKDGLNTSKYDFFQSSYWGAGTMGRVNMGNYETLYVLRLSTDMTTNPENLPNQVYILYMESQGFLANPNGSIMATRTLCFQVLISVTTNEAYIYKWYEKHKDEK